MGWKIYFWVFTILIVISALYGITYSLGILFPDEIDPARAESWIWVDWVYLPVVGISIFGLFGYAYQKTFGKQSFWKRWFIFILIFDASSMVYEYSTGVFDIEGMWQPVITLSLLIAIFLPYYVALYLYSYKSEELWNPQPTPPQ